MTGFLSGAAKRLLAATGDTKFASLARSLRRLPEGPPKAYWSADADTLVQQLGSAQDGLSTADAAGRLREYGRNEVREHRSLTRTRVLANQLRNPLLLVLIFAAVASALTGEWVDAAIVVVIVLATVSIGYTARVPGRDRRGGSSGARAHTSPRPSRYGARWMCLWKRSCRATSCCSPRAAWCLRTA